MLRVIIVKMMKIQKVRLRKICILWIQILVVLTNEYHGYQLMNGASSEIIQITAQNKCSYVFQNQTFGIITSPYYPMGYLDNISCEWRIEMEAGARIVMSIRSFTLGPGDRLEIEDSKLYVYSLSNPPSDVIFSASNLAIIRLISDKTLKNKIDSTIEELKKNRTFYAVFEKEGCGGLLTESSGYITVPSYIHMSLTPHECAWTVISPANKVIVLQFLQFDLAPGSCLYSNIYIREGDQTAGYVLGDFCEENPPLNQLRSSTNIVHIFYRNRPNVLASKAEMIPTIKMFYKVEESCGGVLEGFSGSFATPRRWLDDVYSCNWSIKVPNGKQILLKIRQWQVHNATAYEYDEIKFILPNRNSIFWKSHGDVAPPDSVTVPSNKLILSLTSHRNKTSTTKIRFQGFYQAVNSVERQCIDVGNKQLLMCDEWRYIDCSLRCDGVIDCDNGKDESSCPNINTGSMLAMQHVHHRDPQNPHSYVIFLFTIVGVLMIVTVISVAVDRFYRKGKINIFIQSKHSKPKNQRPYLSNIHPPPYTAIATDSSRVTTPPPPYSIEGEEHHSTAISETYVTNFHIVDETDGTSYNDTNSPNESTEMFHNTDILGSITISTDSLIVDNVTNENKSSECGISI